MTSEQFTDWLAGYLKRVKSESNGLTANQVKTIKKNLAKVEA